MFGSVWFDVIDQLRGRFHLIRPATARQNDLWKDPSMKNGIRALALFGLTISLFSGCGILGRRCNDCNGCNAQIGCRPCAVGWQRGGTDYGNHLRGNGGYNNCGHHSYAQDTQTGSGVPAPATAYPYYTVRGPRDFFANNPPSLGR
jgi:hypothetical protein